MIDLKRSGIPLVVFFAAGAAAQDSVVPSVSESPAFLFAAARMLAGEPDRTDEALELFERAVAGDPDAPFLRIGLADFLGQLRRLDEAAEHAAAAYRAAPEDVDVLRSYAGIQMAIASRGGDGPDPVAVDRAVEALEQLRRLAPADIEGMMRLYQVRSVLEEYVEAAEVLEELVSHHNGNRQLRSMLIDALRRAGKDAEAERVLADMVRFDQRSVESRLELAQMESQRGNHTEAIELLQAVAAEFADNVRIRGALAEEYYRRGVSRGRSPEERAADLEESLRRLRALPGPARRSPEARLLEARVLGAVGERGQAIAVLESLLREAPGDPQVLRELLPRLMDSEEWGRIRDIGRALLATADRDTPDGARAADMGWKLLVEALRELDDIDGALAALDSEERVSGVSAELTLSRAGVLAEAGRRRRALAVLRGAEVANEELVHGDAGEPDFRALERKAQLYFDMDADRAAVEVLEAIAADEDVGILSTVAGFCQGNGRFAESVVFLERALALLEDGEDIELDGPVDGVRANLLFMLGSALERTKRYREAADRFRQVLTLEPDNGLALNYLGYMWADNGENLEEALALVRRAVELDPTNGAFVDSLGWTLYRLGEYDQARRHLERANQLTPKDSTILEHLGDVYAALGDVERARAAYREAFALNDEENVDAVRRKLNGLSR